jgi:hypothetical protein
MRPLCIAVLIQLLTATVQAQDAPPSLVAAVQTYVEKKGDHERPDFRHALADLDGDGHADAVVLLMGTWCGSGGCNMLIFRAINNGFTLVSGSTVTSEPVRLLPDKTHGWNTLIVYSKGKGDVLMPFNGQRYPLNPSTQPKATAAQIAAARILLK